MFAAASSFFARTAISQSYNIAHSPASRSSTPNLSSAASPASPPLTAAHPTIHVGLWKVHPASHKVTNKRVSVWSFDKRSTDIERLGVAAKERVLDVLKAEASALGRLRHPCILEMVEPLEETRYELMFATEPVLSSLDASIPGSSRHPLVELDEIEIRKGIIQICKGLSFIHSSAQLIHSNICPESIVINGAGDWKLSGLGLTIPLMGPGGKPTRWEFPTFDGHAPAYVQRSFDYIAPEYALDEVLLTGSDMYSLGCLIYAVHSKGTPPFRNHGSLGSLREHAGAHIPNMSSWDPDLQSLLKSLITRTAPSRPTPTTLGSQSFFSSLAISTLNFLDRSNFTTKTREEKVSFMKGLTAVLDKFSERLQTRKILPSLLEEMKDPALLPYILPNVFVISKSLNPSQFAIQVLPSLKPLFAVKEPPQNMLTLLDNLEMLQSKTDKAVFREQVLPLVYNALASDHAVVQERGLRAIPDLCESVDYAEVSGPMFYNVACVFKQTKLLTVKVATLLTLLTLVKTLDQTVLTQKMVPLLSNIRTKEPAVMMATLSVQEAMGFKVDREAVATLVLPQLWAMSIGPLLNVDQFERFMQVIRKLGDRVHIEHNQFLRDSQRIEDRSATSSSGFASSSHQPVDFQSLVGGSNGTAPAISGAPIVNGGSSWDDDAWGSILGGDNVSSLPSSPAPAPIPSNPFPKLASPQQRSTSQSYSRASTSSTASSSSPTPAYVGMTPTLTPSARPSYNASSPLGSRKASTPVAAPQTPNYNISFSASESWNSQSSPPPAMPPAGTTAMPGLGSILAPSKPQTPWKSSSQVNSNDWDDFDPLA
ncbi:kinase-like domain-containing protein [Pterulicium gracile]|uniref:Kinase-like domain-containing protein n=1 Tax=Pterulicium gracile TaxID=1884261 RepID=A0A5C3R828_9AGAR|nr:kinase-like domain-containing protein [Pterula gracilis]